MLLTLGRPLSSYDDQNSQSMSDRRLFEFAERSYMYVRSFQDRREPLIVSGGINRKIDL
ncbi:hypothetical protein B0H34DRAFT_711710, partial [Crassisporium funariophilum]